MPSEQNALRKKVLREMYIAAGCCAQCGNGLRLTDGDKHYCASCREKQRLSGIAFRARKRTATVKPPSRNYQQRKRDARRAAGLCTDCGGPRDTEGIARGRLMCAACRAYHARKTADRVRQTRATGFYTDGRGGEPIPTGFHKDAPKVGVVGRLTVSLNLTAVRCIEELKSADYARRVAEAAGTGKRVEKFFQVSRILREAIRRYQGHHGVPIRPLSSRLTICQDFSFRVDAVTLAIVRREAARRGGNVSYAICDLLIAAADSARAPRLAASGSRPGRHLYDPTYDPDWDD